MKLTSIATITVAAMLLTNGALAPASATKEGVAEDTRVPEQLFVNTAWKTSYGTNFEFQEDRRGIRTFSEADRTAFNWKRLPDGLVEVRGPFRKGGLEVTWYFRFESNKEAYYGPHTNEVDRPLKKLK